MNLLTDPSILEGKVALFGGSFDPIHNGHIQIAKTAKEKFSLSAVVFIPAWKNPLKEDHPSISGEERLELVKVAIEKESGFYVSPFEIEKKETSYTIDTIRYFQSKSKAEFSFLLGSDSLKEFHKWKAYEEILKSVNLIVYERREHLVNSYSELSKNFITGEWIDISSTFVRGELEEGRIPSGLIPKSVAEKIRKYKLYGFKQL